ARARIGLAALKPLRDAVAAIKDRTTLSKALGTLHAHGVRAALSLTAAPDFRAGATTILHLDSGGLTLGDRSYYLDAKEPLGGADYSKLRRAYEDAVAAVFEAAGESSKDARGAARDVLALETQLARAARSSYERRAAPMLHDRIDLVGLAEEAPQLDWTAYFAALGGDAPAINTTSRAYLHRVGVLAKSVRAGMWQHYLEWRLLYTFGFDGTVELAAARRAVDGLHAEPAAAPELETRCARATIEALPALIASQLVAEPVRERATAITGALAEELARGAAASTWMTESTRARAVAKVGAVQRTVAGTDPGTPPAIGAGHLANAIAARRAATARALGAARAGTDAWSNPAHTGVSYQWLGNTLRVPAGVLAMPIVSTERPIALDLGALAALAGHELAHAIDERGADWSERGDLGNWWQAADDAAFARTSACFVARARAAKLDAHAVLGEARADAAGIAAGVRALPAMRATSPRHRIADLSDEQLYFLGAATALCAREPAVTGGNRPPARYRVNATFADLPAFADAWSCPANAPMRAATPCTP
ncbi:MAG TPA: M13-type metalloendopeptidase, partial [Kofleriaceae bacterium]|nr:M13-type metalloendopeptidase [Kofleriaceae bacterium]